MCSKTTVRETLVTTLMVGAPDGSTNDSRTVVVCGNKKKGEKECEEVVVRAMKSLDQGE